MRLVPLEETRLLKAARMLARAFHEDPLQKYAFPDETERRRRSVTQFEALLRYGMLAGEVWVTAGEVAAAGIWRPPGAGEPDGAAAETSGLARLPELVGVEEMTRFSTLADHLDERRREDIGAPHWYAMVLGVEPAMQGLGLGSGLLEAILPRADAAGAPCYLETCNPRNVGFYRRHGFRVLREGREPKSGLDYWTFLREPRSTGPFDQREIKASQ